jgi:uridine monophosphate synthetase
MSIITELINKDCIKLGNFTLRNGDISKYYFDMKNLVSYPDLLKKVGDEMYSYIDKNNCDIICGVPIGALPIASYISTKYDIPMIITRNEVKSYGTTKQIEGNYKKTDKCIIIEDVITTGGSVQKTIDILKDKVDIVGVIVIIDRQQGFNCSVPVTSLITKTDIVKYRLKSIMEQKKTRLCFSGDVENTDELFHILREIGQYISICKIHYDIYNDRDEAIKKTLIEYSIKYNFLIMEDRKLVDISHITKKQYKRYENWVDMVTVMGTVNSEVVKGLSGVLLVANMSNNNWDFTENAVNLARENPRNMIGFITQKRIDEDGMMCMTPGISLDTNNIADQNYRSATDVDTDVIIVGRGIYNYDDYAEKAKLYSKI